MTQKKLPELLFMTLQKNGDLTNILAQIQESVYGTLLDNKSELNEKQKTNKENLDEDLIQLLLQFLELNNLRYTASVLRSETGIGKGQNQRKPNKEVSLLENIYKNYLEKQDKSLQENSDPDSEGEVNSD
ncbi:lish domain-containing protein fopnl [Anaeramoeba flamelloides]|uniref:Lish domain-containing protein fopnl n=1 Tax=Anaeramoeba flamelloides TaxID=1746091 RepID=A0AAV8AF63_9EUKA|nr:lish domain-containing protein fopnl [Anaeramoeba flamelloides]KAJ6226303.1 lish domain-containing protein fopnl [Anaeramoeba flamelloides]